MVMKGMLCMLGLGPSWATFAHLLNDKIPNALELISEALLRHL